jgi:CheY-like chemotaxis protein
MRGRILIVDDSAEIRALIRQLLADAGFEIAGEAANGEEAIHLADQLQPDAITMDLDMPVLDGAEATRIICTTGCAPIVIVSGSESNELVGVALEAGARWHVAKKHVADQLVAVLESLLRVAAQA